MNMLEYRIATASDIPQLAQMRWDFRQEDDDEPHVMTRAEFIESCQAFLMHGMHSGQWVYWVAAQQDIVVSHIFIFRIQSVPRPCKHVDYWDYMTNVYTKPTYRKQGIGSALMKHAVQWAKTQGLALMIVSPSDASIPFYQRAGFTCETEFMQHIFHKET
ncbi:MAG: GNAT family N-acetyltransferase [bacterium]|nr:GNAT family N-acetyltransferase [bacterium]